MTVVVEGDVGRSLVTINDVLVVVYRVVWELLSTMVNLAGVGGKRNLPVRGQAELMMNYCRIIDHR